MSCYLVKLRYVLVTTACYLVKLRSVLVNIMSCYLVQLRSVLVKSCHVIWLN